MIMYIADAVAIGMLIGVLVGQFSVWRYLKKKFPNEYQKIHNTIINKKVKN